MLKGMFVPEILLSLLAAIRVFFRSRSDTALEVLALRQQVAVLKRKRPRPKLNARDRLFWTTLRQCWSRWPDVLVLVKPDTVVGWHRAGFRLYWRWRSRPRGGRPKITEEIRALIQRLAQENLDWGAPKIHGELLKLGFVVSERTVARYLRRVRRRGDPSKSWLAFLQNHREVIAAFDFFTVPTLLDIRVRNGSSNNCAKLSRKLAHDFRCRYQFGYVQGSGNRRKRQRYESKQLRLVGAGRFERPTPCAQGRCATRLRYAPTFRALLILKHFSVRCLPDSAQTSNRQRNFYISCPRDGEV